MKQWIPYRPDTWPYRYGILKKPIGFSVYLGTWNEDESGRSEPDMLNTLVPAGTKVQITMCSRFGDIGITDELGDTHGYKARGIDIDKIHEWLDNLEGGYQC